MPYKNNDGPNLVPSPFPFGSVSEKDVADFEAASGVEFPQAYRDYLLSYNGGLFERLDFYWGDGDEISFTIDRMFGLHSGPLTSRLQENFAPHAHNGLERHWAELRKYIAIGATRSGDLLLLRKVDGEVCVLYADIEDIPLYESQGGPIAPLGLSFDEFASSLMTEEEANQRLLENHAHSDLAERLDQLKKEREARVLARQRIERGEKNE